MSTEHFTSRRGFIAAVGFGAVGLYGAWAAYGAAPVPFLAAAASADPAEPEMAMGHSASGSEAEEFLQRHAEFMARSAGPGGSVVPQAGPDAAMLHVSAAPAPTSGSHDAAAMADHSAMADADHGGAGEPVPIDVYLLAYRFGFEPSDLRLTVNRPYRFRMMAADVPHGASLQLGRGSRIIRLRPNVVSEQTIAFSRPGEVLVYCTVFCGAGHDAMAGRITVA